MNNTGDMKTYLEKCGEPKTMRTDVQFLEEPRQIEEFMFLGLRKTRGISKKEFRRVFGRDIELVYGKGTEKTIFKRNASGEKGQAVSVKRRRASQQCGPF